MDKILSKYLDASPRDYYLKFHAPRYEILLNLFDQIYLDQKKILDIGRSKFAEILSEKYSTPVDTLGLEYGENLEKSAGGNYYQFNLNNCSDPDLLRKDLPRYDIIIFCEVLEHLHTSPSHVFTFLKTIMERGAVIILQTPNAVALGNRKKMLFGKNPFDLIREDETNPGHFREYTRQEIIQYSEAVSLKIDRFFYGNYFDLRYAHHENGGGDIHPMKRLHYHIYNLVPDSLKIGMTFVLSRNATD